MDYFKILNLSREPFSNSPDPDHFFFNSRQHVDCLQKVELAVRLQRGLNVVIGDVGTGKTTLCRRLIRNFAHEIGMETHLILDPYFSTPVEFLSRIRAMFGKSDMNPEMSDWELKEEIKKYIFQRAVNEDVTIVLIIDEGQNLSWECLEILREFLNYETNEKKLLQIVLFAQEEFQKYLEDHENFADRINLYHILRPLNFRDTKAMIKYRLDLASEGELSSASFSLPALWAIYRASRGYPRKIINICHRAMLTIIIQNRTKVNARVARFSIRKSVPAASRSRPWLRITVPSAVAALILSVLLAQGTISVPWKIGTGPFFVDKGPKQGVAETKEFGQNLNPGHEGGGHQVSHYAGAGTVPGKGAGMEPQAISSGMLEIRKVPDVLGRIAVAQSDTLGTMIYNVYGVFNEKYLRMITDHNNEIRNPDLIESGQEIEFPAVMAEVPRASLKSWWVLLADKSTLEEAYGFAKDHRGSGIQMAIIPNWNSNDGLKFSILYRKSFADEKSAKGALGMLPENLSVDADIKNGWASDTIFFASPVFASSK